MKRFIEGENRRQATLLPDSLEDYVTEDNPVRVVDVFIDELDLEALGFSGVVPEVHTHRGVLRMLQARAADILMPDVQRMGGPTEFLKAGALCEAFNTPISSHLFPEVSLPLLAALPNAFYLEYMPWFEPLYGQTLVLNGAGQAVVPTAAGWGAGFDRAAIARREVA